MSKIVNLSFNLETGYETTTTTKVTRSTFSRPNCKPISILPALSKVMEKLFYVQIQEYFTVNGLSTKFQHAVVGLDRGLHERTPDFFPPPGFSYSLKCLFKDSACYHPEIMGQRGYF